jgi:hypothetical protein
MKNIKTILLFLSIVTISCSKDDETYSTNGETIFRTGRNIQGTVLVDLSQSQVGKIHGCAQCHGDNGKGKYRGGGNMQTGSIAYNDLLNPTLYNPVYNDSLIKRFIDSETKSDDTHANTGIVFVMSEIDKIDLIIFLKTL